MIILPIDRVPSMAEVIRTSELTQNAERVK